MDKQCSSCGKPIKSNDKFCPSCGHPAGQKAGRSGISRGDHYIVLGILAVVVIAYFGYQAIQPEKSVDQNKAHSQNAGAIPMDMDAFVQNLPTDFLSLVSMGNALMDEGRYELAIMCYSRALEQKPEDADVLVDLGTCQHSLGLNQEAIDSFTKALEYDPTHHIAKFNMGIVYYTAGEYKSAAEWWNRLLSENPEQQLKEETEELLQQVQAEY